MDESVKFAWAYLLMYGKLTSGEWSYYGGCWEDAETRYVPWDEQKKRMQRIQEKAVSVGIDWDKTGVPAVSEESEFMGTFASCQGECLATLGTLVLKNGETYLIASKDDDAAHLAETARKLLEGKSSPVTVLAEKL
jgi:hypothetical protein